MTQCKEHSRPTLSKCTLLSNQVDILLYHEYTITRITFFFSTPCLVETLYSLYLITETQ